MFDLLNRIARLELLTEQLVVHLRYLDKTTPEARRTRRELFALFRELRQCKQRKQALEAEINGLQASIPPIPRAHQRALH